MTELTSLVALEVSAIEAELAMRCYDPRLASAGIAPPIAEAIEAEQEGPSQRQIRRERARPEPESRSLQDKPEATQWIWAPESRYAASHE